jgi:hypothetical protein
MTREVRGALAGASAAVLWWASDPALKRAFGTPYSDTELLAPFVTRGPLEPALGLLVHTGNGAAFGYLFARLGGRGVRCGLAAALAENTLLWPALAVLERRHPYCRDGTWPARLAANPRVFAQATAGHALFGVLLGALAPR